MNNSTPQENAYQTRDLGLATYLVSIGHELTGTALKEPRKVIFEIKRREDTDRLVLDYFNGTAEAPAKKLFEQYRNLRGIVYSRINNVR
jgi:hypothetical protein